MHKIDAPHATDDHEFTDGNPATGIEATELISKWFNTVQRELVSLVLSAGLTLSDAEDDQVLEAIQTILAAHGNLTGPHGATSLATALRLVLRDAAGRAQFVPGVAGGDAVIYSQLQPVLSQSWNTATLEPGWVYDSNGEAPVVYRLERADILRVKGIIRANSNGLALITVLPAGYRPTSDKTFWQTVPVTHTGVYKHGRLCLTNTGNLAAYINESVGAFQTGDMLYMDTTISLS